MTHHRPAGRRRAALTLAVLTPVVAELGLGSTPMHLAFLLLLWLPIYGAGVLLIREAVRRVGGGWASLVLLGVAYELVEDGIGLQALSSPHLYGAAGWAPRLFGLNTAYWEVNVVYHVVFSVLVPIALTDLIFPAHADRPYLKRGGLVGVAVCAVVGVALLRVSVPPSQDPGYVAPAWVLLGCVAAVALLAVVALRVLPRRAARPLPAGPAPAPWLAAAVGAGATLVFFALAYPAFGAKQPAFTHGAWALVPMAVAALVAAGTTLLVYRWSGRRGWNDRHRIRLVGGALLAHTAYGVAGVVHTLFDRVGLAVLGLLTLALLAALDRRRTPALPQPAAAR
ncbi:hypothetical protein GCM10022220_11690 [Actinocatenispora rupis]|uniref:Uncharacterized protein n=1 Tax=Actinocatenispora rupis TaxID=519421 RepID=A0A8J3ITX1_9ACTN|nr:hypothetical protein Aru02nite_07250 [Actinocatenispora rupis]